MALAGCCPILSRVHSSGASHAASLPRAGKPGRSGSAGPKPRLSDPQAPLTVGPTSALALELPAQSLHGSETDGLGR